MRLLSTNGAEHQSFSDPTGTELPQFFYPRVYCVPLSMAFY